MQVLSCATLCCAAEPAGCIYWCAELTETPLLSLLAPLRKACLPVSAHVHCAGLKAVHPELPQGCEGAPRCTAAQAVAAPSAAAMRKASQKSKTHEET